MCMLRVRMCVRVPHDTTRPRASLAADTCCGRADAEWAALVAVLLEWLQGPRAVGPQPQSQVHAGGSTASHVLDTPHRNK